MSLNFESVKCLNLEIHTLQNLLNPDLEKARLQKRLEKVMSSLEKATSSQGKRGSKISPDIQQRYTDKVWRRQGQIQFLIITNTYRRNSTLMLTDVVLVT